MDKSYPTEHVDERHDKSPFRRGLWTKSPTDRSAGLSLAATGLLDRIWTYCTERENDGLLDDADRQIIWADARDRSAKTAWQELAEVGRLVYKNEGWLVTGWLAYNASRQRRDDGRKSDRDRQARHRKQANPESGDVECHAVTEPVTLLGRRKEGDEEVETERILETAVSNDATSPTWPSTAESAREAHRAGDAATPSQPVVSRPHDVVGVSPAGRSATSAAADHPGRKTVDSMSTVSEAA